ncbi:MAG: HD domain-containing protein [Lachnospiraceae bacterium]|nr:HD domain-containing protein [Lachnospiraceae bacterium]
MKIQMPDKVRKILHRLQEHGFEAYAVGGCVRDACLGRVPSDWDITTSAMPEQVKGLFRRCVDTGIAHGTITVMIGEDGFEVTTYRVDGKYSDGRHPDEVRFTPCLEEDLKRRDFTINAMAYNDTAGLIDLFGGLEDLQNRCIRCVGDPRRRFNEDALRLLRAIRFSAQLDFEIDPDTFEAARELAGTLSRISEERIAAELIKLLQSAHPEKMQLIYESGMSAVFLPEWDRIAELSCAGAHHSGTVGEHTLRVLQNVRPDRMLRLAALMHDFGKAETAVQREDGGMAFPEHAREGEKLAKKILQRLKLDRLTMDTVGALIRIHSESPGETPAQVRHFASAIGPELFESYAALKRADILSRSAGDPEEDLKRLERAEELFTQILERGDCLCIRQLALSGRDLIADGMQGGPAMGKVLEALLDEVLTDPEKNTREYLLERSRELRGQ